MVRLPPEANRLCASFLDARDIARLMATRRGRPAGQGARTPAKKARTSPAADDRGASSSSTSSSSAASSSRSSSAPVPRLPILDRLPLDMAGLCASFMDERDIARVMAVSKADHARVTGPQGLRMISREHNRTPTVVDFWNPTSRRASYAGHRNLELWGMDERVHDWLVDNTEVETVTLAKAPDGCHQVHEIYHLARFPRLSALTVYADLEDSGREDLLKVRATLGHAPLASLTRFTLGSDDWNAEAEDFDLGQFLGACRLQHLDLSGCALGRGHSGSFAADLYRLLHTQAATLRSLTVNIYGLHDPAEGLALAAALRNLPGLTHLAFADQYQMYHLSDEGWMALGEALSRLESLESLDCRGMGVKDREALLGAVIRQLPANLKELKNLPNLCERFGETEWHPTPHFQEALERFPHLQDLSFSDPLTLETVRGLATALLAKASFRTLEITLDPGDHRQGKDALVASLETLAEDFRKAGRTLDYQLTPSLDQGASGR